MTEQPVSTATEVKTVIAAEKIVESVPPALLRLGINGMLSAVLSALRFADEKGWVAVKTWTDAIDSQADDQLGYSRTRRETCRSPRYRFWT